MNPFLTWPSALCFIAGVATVYIMFRMMGIFILMVFLSIAISSNAQTLEIQNLSGAPYQDMNGAGSVYVFPAGLTTMPLSIDVVNQWNADVIASDIGSIGLSNDWLVAILNYGGGVVGGSIYQYPVGTLSSGVNISNSSTSVNYWLAYSEGLAAGFLFAGFGWTYRLVKQISWSND